MSGIRARQTTVADAVEAFLSERDLRPQARRTYGFCLHRLVDRAGHQPVNRLQLRTVRGFLDTHYGHAAPATWNLNLAALRSFFAYCARQGWTSTDPTAGIGRRHERRNPDLRVIPADQLERLWRRRDLPPRDKTLWRLLFDTAMRAEEALSLNIEDIDEATKTAVVVGKGGQLRPVNWYTQTARLLRPLIGDRETGPVFLADRRPRIPMPTADLDPHTGRARLSYRRAAAVFTGTTGWTLHQLRHTRIRQLKDENCPLPILQKITGHGSLRTLTEHYPGPSPDAVTAWYTTTDPNARRHR